MSDLDKLHIEREAVRAATGVRSATRYGEALNRYFGAVGYRDRRDTGAVPRTADRAGRHPLGVVLVGVDETPTSYTAVDHAAIEADLRGWDLRLLHVVPLGGVRDPLHDGAKRLVERMTDRIRACSPQVAVSSRIDIGPAATLLLADAHNANLVVVGHRHGSAGVAFGLSVADRVASHHTGPVLVVRVPGWPPGPDFGARPVVVGVDEAPTTTAAVAFAVEEARVRGCEVIMLHAGVGDATVGDRLIDAEGVPVYHRRVPGDPVGALIEASGRAAAVVVGRRGPGGFAGSMLGSVSRSLVQRAYCPVFLVG